MAHKIRNSVRVIWAVSLIGFMLHGRHAEKNFDFKDPFVLHVPRTPALPLDFQMAVTCEDGYRLCYIYSDEGKLMASLESDQLHVSKGFTRDQVMKRLRALAWSDLPPAQKDHNLI